MKPIIKWTGGKRREIKHFIKLIPSYETYIEPFIGGGALYFHLNSKINIINDFEYLLINFYKIVQNNPFELIKLIDEIKQFNQQHDEMEKLYYHHRNNINNYKSLNELEQSLSFLYVNQLSFSGMRRFNKKGEFNVPFGHYKSFNPIITTEHIDLLNKTTIYNDDISNIFNKLDIENGFMFLDPPYTKIFKEYSANNNFNHNSHIELYNNLNKLKKTKWMLIINNDDDIINLYKQYDITSYDIKYGVNIKNRFDSNSNHLIIKNY